MFQKILPLSLAALVLTALCVVDVQAGAGRRVHLTPTPAKVERAKPLVQLAILLDTSSSMDGLIDQARSQLWSVVNEFLTARQDGVAPRLEIALYEYGNDGLPAKGGFIRQVSPFTDDLDVVSEKLFSLTTNGGSEFAGKVIQTALQDLEWSRSKDALRVVFIAGNEPFTQGPVDYRTAIAAAKESGILVNTIHCGDAETGAASGWRDAALLAGGRYLSIDQNRAVVHIPSPHDAEIVRLGVDINRTYIHYGARGAASFENQAAQDNNAFGSGMGSVVQRALTKNSGYYRNYTWDLVDALNDKHVKLADIDKKTLPKALQGKSDAEIRRIVAARSAQRQKMQKRVQELNRMRRTFVAKERKRRSSEGEKSFDEAMIETIHAQAVANRFTFE